MTSRERIHATLRDQPRDRVAVAPIFMAWAAHAMGRSYRDYYLDHRVLVECQMHVAQRFGLDQVSTISDPWREASAYGMQFEWPEQDVGVPQDYLLKGPDDFHRLEPLEVMASERTRDRVLAVELFRRMAGDDISVLGWVEGPIAIYADLRGVEQSMLDLFDDPDTFHRACDVLVPSAIAFARHQVEAGADMIGVGDALASVVGPQLYEQHIQPQQKRLIDGLHDLGTTVRMHICGDITPLLPAMRELKIDVVDCDHMVDLAHARQVLGPAVTLCGNLDPVHDVKNSLPALIAEKARACLQAAGRRFILQAGCELPPETPAENIAAFCAGPGSLILEDLQAAAR